MNNPYLQYTPFSAGFAKMNWPFIRALIVLPGTVLVLVPAAILWASAGTEYAVTLPDAGQVIFWVALLIAVVGLGLRIWTDSLFLKFGDGTLAPWNPPKKLVIRGPYRHVRNPMITSVVIILLAESMFLQSWPLTAWTLFFFAVHTIYFPLIEEKGLKKRFGQDYLVYQANVPRWIPRLRPWPETQHH